MPRHAELVLPIFAVCVLVAAAPILVALAGALVPLILAGGLIAGFLRIVWWHTRKW
jgi:hypothetical protein